MTETNTADQQELIIRLREENELLRKALGETECGRKLIQQKDEFSQFLEIGKAIVSELDLEKVFELVANRAREIIDAELVIVPIINDAGDRYTYMAAAGEGAEDMLGIGFKIHVGMCGWVLQNERSLLFGKSDEWWMDEKTAWEEGQQSALLVPLFDKRRIIGGLSAIGKIGGDTFSIHDMDLFTLFANQVSIAIENARLFQDHQKVIAKLEQEISEREKTQTALEKEKEQLAVTLRSIGDGVITTDTEGNIVLINKVAEKLTGWAQSAAIGRPLDEVFNIICQETREPCDNPAKKILRSGEIIGIANHTALVAKDGTERSIADSGAPIRDKNSRTIGVVLVFRDVTKSNKMEQELLKVKKLESIGILAGGIAHDFNNILVAILGNLNLASQIIDDNDQIYPMLKDAEKASLRAKDLTQQLLTFSKGGEPVKQTASIPEVIKDSAQFVLSGGNIACQYHIADDLWLVEIDKGQMSQVIQNLILNAGHAMPQGGNIQITCENVKTLTDHDILLPRKDNYVKITISDSGIGIPEDIIDRIFDPYFSTKQKGSGLGLAITHSIVSKHDGHISVQSKTGAGTIFTIYLPASTKEAQTEIKATVEPLPGKGRVMIMDDEEVVRTLTHNILSHFGYEVVLVKDGKEAIKVYEESKYSSEPIDLIIMDLTIPGGMGGQETIEKIHQIDPEAKVIVSSGYSNDPIMANHEDYGFCAAIAKPFQLKELMGIVGQILS